MTVSSTTARSVTSGNGITTAFPFSFVYFDSTDIVVTLVDAAGNETVQTISTEYTLSGGVDSDGVPQSGTVTMITAPATGESLVIERSLPFTQAIDYLQGDPFPAQTNEQGLDRGVMLSQQVLDAIDLRPRLPLTTAPGTNKSLPLPVAGEYLVGKSDASGWEGKTLTGTGTIGIPVSVAEGGTNATTAAAARTNLDAQQDLDVPSQAEAEAGTATTERVWTAQRIGQAIAAQAGMPRSYLAGLGTSNDTDTDHDIAIAAGECRDDANAEDLVLASTLTKQIDAAWAVGDDAGGLDTGTVAADTWYYVWLIKRTDTGVVDALFSTSSSSPTMPTNYDAKRRIGAVLTDSSSNIIQFKQYGDEFWWLDPPLDFNGASATTAQTISLTVPALEVLATINHSSQVTRTYISPLSVNDEAPSDTVAPLSTISHTTNPGVGGVQIVDIRTNSSGQIRKRDGGTNTAYISTLKWIDRRGRDD